MSHAVRLSATRTSSPPPASAAVLHFDCLYTHDLRRKHKRWQDGQLKLHTFNDKYMVYNDCGGFVGDGHWSGSLAEFCEGLELSLDRGAAIVQVDRCTGRTEQDLSQLLDKRAKEVETRRLNAASRVPAINARTLQSGDVVGPASHVDRTVQHRPSNNSVSDSGPMRKAAVPERAPHEEKNALSPARLGDRAPAQRPTSERRGLGSPPSKEGHAQKLFGTKLTLVNTPIPPRSGPPLSLPMESSSSRTKDSKARNNRIEKGDTQAFTQESYSRRTSAEFGHNLSEKPDVKNSRATPKRHRVQEQEDKDDSSQRPMQMHGSVEPQQSPRATREKWRTPTITSQPRSMHSRNLARPKARDRPGRRIATQVPDGETSEDNEPQSSPMVECPETGNAHSGKGSKRLGEENRKDKGTHHGHKADNRRLEGEIRRHGQAGELGALANAIDNTEAALADASSHFSTERRIQLRSKSKPKRGLLILSEMAGKTAGDPEVIGRTASGNNPQVVPEGEDQDSNPADEPKGSSGSSPPGTKRKKRKEEGGDESGLRIKRMARKSVKSKEIFGLAFPANDPIPSPFVSLAEPLRAGPGCQVETLPVRAGESPSPATREQEAAGEDDGAGPVPQPIHMCDIVTVRPEPLHPDGSMEIGTDSHSKSPVSRNAERKSVAESTVGGGAWSRHAEDLLGMTRPVMRALCR